jgi:hypothetical protein
MKGCMFGKLLLKTNKNNNLQLNSLVVFKLIFYIGRNCSLFLFAIEAQLPITTLVPMLFLVEFHNDKRKSSVHDKNELFWKYCAKSCHILREKNLKSSYFDNMFFKVAKT